MTLMQEQKPFQDFSEDDLVRNHQGLVHHIARRYWATGFDREDMVAEANIGLVKAIRGFREEDGYRFSTFAGTVIENHLIKVVRNSRTAKRAGEADVLYLHVPIVDGEGRTDLFIDSIEGPSLKPEDETLGEALHVRLMELIDEPGLLQNRVREVVKLTLQGLDLSEIAEELGTSYKSVSTAMTRARDALRYALTAEGLIEGTPSNRAKGSSLAEWVRKAKENGVSENKFRMRISRGWEPEQATLPNGKNDSILRPRFTEEDRIFIREKLIEGLNGGEIFEARFEGRKRQSVINLVGRIRKELKEEGLL